MARDIMMFVGEKYYPTAKSFIDEAWQKGVCKRVPNVPGITPGKSRCFLLHRDGGKRPRVIGYFVIEDVAVMISGANLSELIQKYGSSVRYCDRAQFPAGERGCGEMKPGGCYIVSADLWEAAKGVAEENIIGGGLTVFRCPWPKLPANFPHFRGYRYIEGDSFIENLKWPQATRKRLGLEG